MQSGPNALDQALDSARRVYDRQVAELQQIDDKAMRTPRTAVLVLGFVVAALTTAGPSAVSNLSVSPLLLGAAGVLALFLSATVGIAIYTVTEYSLEATPATLQNSKNMAKDAWMEDVLDHLEHSMLELREEIEQNGTYLEFAQIQLLLGITSLLLAMLVTVGKRAFGFTTLEIAFLILVTFLTLLALQRYFVAQALLGDT